MTLQPNGTDAKDIALHFINLTVERPTKAMYPKTIRQAKSLLSSGYTKEEVIKVIDYLVNTKHVNMYSLGYVSTSINEVLKEVTELEKVELAKKELALRAEQMRNEVNHDSDSTERNREKARRISVQSRFGKKYNFDMFEGHGQDS